MNWRLSPNRTAAGVVAALGAAATIACSDFLEVEDPGRYTDDALNTPLALKAVANGVESDLMTVMDDVAWTFGLMSDEYMHTGTWNPSDDLDKGRAPIFPDGGYMATFLARRTAAQKAQERFTKVMGDTANRTELMAKVVAVEAWSNLYLGMYNCEAPKAPLGEPVSSLELFKLSIPLFTKAAEIARAARSTTYERFAIAGRARANLFAGNLDAAIADARQIPDNFVFNAKFSATGPNHYIVTVSYRGRNKAAGFDQIHWSKVDTIAGFIKDPYTGQLDRRLGITHPRNERGADGVTQHYNQEKYRNIDDDQPMTSGLEMRLIEAEAQMRKGNLTEAMTIINRLRTAAGLTPHSTAGITADKVQEYLLWERFVILYLEGQRMYDLQRFNLARTVLGANRPLQFSMSDAEIQLNPHTNGSTANRCFPRS